MSDENLDVINRNIINGLSSLGDQIRHVGEQTEYVSRQIESVSAEQEGAVAYFRFSPACRRISASTYTLCPLIR